MVDSLVTGVLTACLCTASDRARLFFSDFFFLFHTGVTAVYMTAKVVRGNRSDSYSDQLLLLELY